MFVRKILGLFWCLAEQMKHQAEGVSPRGLPLSIQHLLFSFKAEKLGTCIMHPMLLEACLYWLLKGLLVAVISRNKTWTLDMDVHESALMPRLVSDPRSRVAGSKQHPWLQQPAKEHVDGALPLYSPASPSFAMQKLRAGKEGTNILLGMASALLCGCTQCCCGVREVGTGAPRRAGRSWHGGGARRWRGTTLHLLC